MATNTVGRWCLNTLLLVLAGSIQFGCRSNTAPTRVPPASCAVKSDCHTSLPDDLSRAAPAAASIQSAECVEAQTGSAKISVQGADAGDQSGIQLCRCTTTDGTVYTLGGDASVECSRVGRRGQCLYATDEFPGCNKNDAASCVEPCRVLSERLVDNANTLADVNVRSTSCVRGQCSFIYEIDQRCFHNRVDSPVECDLSDDAIHGMTAAP